MSSASHAFVYVLTSLEFRKWRYNPRTADGRNWRYHIQQVARRKARLKHRERVLILSPEGLTIAEIDS